MLLTHTVHNHIVRAKLFVSSAALDFNTCEKSRCHRKRHFFSFELLGFHPRDGDVNRQSIQMICFLTFCLAVLLFCEGMRTIVCDVRMSFVVLVAQASHQF